MNISRQKSSRSCSGMSSPSICLSSTKLSRSSEGRLAALGDQLDEVADDRHHRVHPSVAAARRSSGRRAGCPSPTAGTVSASARGRPMRSMKITFGNSSATSVTMSHSPRWRDLVEDLAEALPQRRLHPVDGAGRPQRRQHLAPGGVEVPVEHLRDPPVRRVGVGDGHRGVREHVGALVRLADVVHAGEQEVLLTAAVAGVDRRLLALGVEVVEVPAGRRRRHVEVGVVDDRAPGRVVQFRLDVGHRVPFRRVVSGSLPIGALVGRLKR